MDTLRKDPRITTRYSAEQLERLGLAACVASRRLRETVDESSLSRDFTNAAVNEMLRTATAEELSQADADLAARRKLEAARRRDRKERNGKERRQAERRTPVKAER